MKRTRYLTQVLVIYSITNVGLTQGKWFYHFKNKYNHSAGIRNYNQDFAHREKVHHLQPKKRLVMCMNGSKNITRIAYLPEALLDEAFALSIYKLVRVVFFSNRSYLTPVMQIILLFGHMLLYENLNFKYFKYSILYGTSRSTNI